MSDVLSKSEILAAEDLARVEVSVPEWGGSVYIKMMENEERDRWENDFAKWRVNRNGTDDDWRGFHAHLVTRTACDDTGKLLFAPDDVEALVHKSSKVIRRLSEVACRLNGIGAGAVEDRAKNFGGGQAD